MVFNGVLLVAAAVLVTRADRWSYLKAKAYEVVDGSPYSDPTRPFHESSAFKSAISMHTQVPLNPGDVVFAGDDQVALGPWAEAFGTLRVRNRGIVGNTLEGLTQQVDRFIAARPTALFLSIGARDLAHPHRPLTVEAVAAGVGEVLQRVRRGSPETDVYVLAALPSPDVSVGDSAHAGSLASLNGRLAGVAEVAGADYLDTAGSFLAPSGTLHPTYTEGDGQLNGAGYASLGAVIGPHVARALQRPRGSAATTGGGR